MLWLVLLLAGVISLYWFVVKSLNYWPERGVKHLSPTPIFGNFLKNFFKQQTMSDLIAEVYNAAPNERYVGLYQFMVPTLMLKDPELIKQITVKDFDHFLDHRTFIPEETDPLWGKNLFALKGQRWRDMRSTLSPAFTSSKMKFMFNLISESSEELVKFFLKKNENLITVEMKDVCSRFANDVIASTAFGVKTDSLSERKNEFYLMGKEATDFTSLWKNMKFFGYLVVPSIYKALNVTLFSKEVRQFFFNLVTDTVKTREKNNIVRPDMIHLLLQARKNELKYEELKTHNDAGFATVEESEVGKETTRRKMEISDMDMTSQAMIFFFAGFDVVSSTMCFMAYELAIHPEIQERLRNEIDNVYEECNGKLTYEHLLKMQYLDMVVSETLRKWPVSVAADRICTKPYTLQPKYPHEKPIKFEVDDVLWLPTYALHHDPNNFPNPEKFDPERFSEENKDKIKPYTYIPFGAGPRNCIGSRFALLEIKAMFFHILSSFEIVPTEKTQIPLKLMKRNFNLLAENGYWLGLKKRTKH